jgi:hypothetical protein
MAKFKIGDKVEVKGIGKTVVKTVEEIKSVVGPRTKYGVDIGGGKIMMVPEKDITASNAVRSTNPVVANALVANEVNFNGASAKVRKNLESKLLTLVDKFKRDLGAVGKEAAQKYREYQRIDPDSASLIYEVSEWTESLKRAIDDVW